MHYMHYLISKWILTEKKTTIRSQQEFQCQNNDIPHYYGVAKLCNPQKINYKIFHNAEELDKKT